MRCDEVRIFATGLENQSPGIRAIPIPELIRVLCS